VASLLADTYMNRGNAYSDLGDYQAAIDDFNQALRHKPDSAEIYNNLGLAIFKQGDAPNAITQYDAALRVKPDLAQAHMNRGMARASLGQRDAAAQDLQAAAALFQSQGNAAAAQQVRALAQGVQQQ
jgi:tetratricopeptide (TPR) repeat protein